MYRPNFMAFGLVFIYRTWLVFGANQLSMAIVEKVELELFQTESPCDLIVDKDAWPWLAFDSRVGFTFSMDHGLDGNSIINNIKRQSRSESGSSQRFNQCCQGRQLLCHSDRPESSSLGRSTNPGQYNWEKGQIYYHFTDYQGQK